MSGSGLSKSESGSTGLSEKSRRRSEDRKSKIKSKGRTSLSGSATAPKSVEIVVESDEDDDVTMNDISDGGAVSSQQKNNYDSDSSDLDSDPEKETSKAPTQSDYHQVLADQERMQQFESENSAPRIHADEYIPPKGFSRFDMFAAATQPSNLAKGFDLDRLLEGEADPESEMNPEDEEDFVTFYPHQHVWHIAAPAGLSLEKVKELVLEDMEFEEKSNEESDEDEDDKDKLDADSMDVDDKKKEKRKTKRKHEEEDDAARLAEEEMEEKKWKKKIRGGVSGLDAPQKTVVEANGVKYGVAFEEVDFTLFLPTREGYKASPSRVTKSIAFRPVVPTIFNSTTESDSESEVKSKPQRSLPPPSFLSQYQQSLPKPPALRTEYPRHVQPPGLRMRYRPAGAPDHDRPDGDGMGPPPQSVDGEGKHPDQVREEVISNLARTTLGDDAAGRGSGSKMKKEKKDKDKKEKREKSVKGEKDKKKRKKEGEAVAV